MKTITKVVVLLTIIGAAAATVAVVENRSAKHEAELDKNKPQTHEPGVVHFERGEPQLSAIRSDPVATEAMPAADPVNGRLVYDENVTAQRWLLLQLNYPKRPVKKHVPDSRMSVLKIYTITKLLRAKSLNRLKQIIDSRKQILGVHHSDLEICSHLVMRMENFYCALL